MPSTCSRRGFLRTTAASLAGITTLSAAQESSPRGDGGPLVISSGNGLRAVETAAEALSANGHVMDAVIAGVNRVEEDPDDITVGYGGLPNEEGVVELDSCVMYGPTANAGAVAALRGIKTPSRVAQLVMDRTDHVLIVGEGALRFAKAHGFEETDLLTDKARKAWLKWKESMSDRDDWLPPAENEVGSLAYPFTYGTITCSALSAGGDLAGVTTTSGLSYKIPGRVGDSPIIGAGLYVDNEVGAAGSTGRGEAVIKSCGSHAVVEAMRRGKSPLEACIEVLEWIVRRIRDPRHRDDSGRPTFNVNFYAISKDGRFGAAAIWSGGTYAVYHAGRARIEQSAYLYKRP